MKQVFAISLMAMLLPVMAVRAQQKDILISGKVISFEESFPLEGVAVLVKGTRNITGTMSDGTYTLQLKSRDSILVFSHDGYESKEVKIEADKKEYNVILKSSNAAAISRLLINFSNQKPIKI